MSQVRRERKNEAMLRLLFYEHKVFPFIFFYSLLARDPEFIRNRTLVVDDRQGFCPHLVLHSIGYGAMYIISEPYHGESWQFIAAPHE